MTNQYEVSRILGSVIVGNVDVGHGQIEAYRTLDSINKLVGQSVTRAHRSTEMSSREKHVLREVFLELRDADGDRKSADYYIACREKNNKLYRACLIHGLDFDQGVINKQLMNMRKGNNLKDLNSTRYEIPRQIKEKLRFATEFTATKLRYELGISIDDILCFPNFSEVFHERCQQIVPGYSWLEYRWTILSIRKGRTSKGKDELSPNSPVQAAVEQSVEFTQRISLDDFELKMPSIPMESGVFSIKDDKKDLYISGTKQLRDAISFHCNQNIVRELKSTYWTSTPTLSVDYVQVPQQSVREVAKNLIFTRKPTFNIPFEKAA